MKRPNLADNKREEMSMACKKIFIFTLILSSLLTQVFSQKNTSAAKNTKKTVSSALNPTTTKSPEAKNAVDKLKKNPNPRKNEPVIIYNEDFVKGEELFQLNKPEEAISYFEKALEKEDVDPKVYVYLGVCYYQIKNYDKSLAVCVQGMAKEGSDKKVLAYNAGNSCYAMGNYMRADASYAIALREDENYSPAVLNRANAQLKLDHLEDSKNNYIRYLELEPETPQREKIETIIALLESEIIRRANEKPELINPDSFVENEEMELPDEVEKVIADEIPQEKVEKTPSEIVKADSVAPDLPKENEAEKVLEKVHGEQISDKDEKPVLQEKIFEKVHAEKIVENDETPVIPERVLEDGNPPEIPADQLVLIPIPEKEELPVRKIEELPSEKFGIDDDLRQFEEEKIRAEREEALRAEEERKKAEEEARIKAIEEEKIAKEKARQEMIAKWPAPEAKITAIGGEKFSPDGDGRNESVTFETSYDYLEEEPEGWTIAITDPYGNPFKLFKGQGKPPKSIEWDGRSDTGEVVVSKNLYKARLSLEPSEKDRNRIGNRKIEATAEIHTGLLLEVVVPDHEYKIVVQSISFDPNAAGFGKLPLEQVLANAQTLDEVAQELKDLGGADINIIIEGHANNISGTKKEEETELLPLSQKRDEKIVEELVKRGVDPKILTPKGVGGSDPIADRADRANWWKNRRVEFIIKQ